MTPEDFKFIKREMSFKLIEPGEVRVRVAPAPTGFLHTGTARTALFNYLFAKKYQGIFILRIEDTDTSRSKPEYEKDIMEGLKWLGIEWDEGPIAYAQNQKYIGDHGPYRQSERTEIYKKYLEKLLAENKAYYCFCSEEELEARRQYQLSIGEAPRYSGKCANLEKELVEKYLSEKKSSVIRFRVPAKKIIFEDLIRGQIEFDATLLGDFVTAKSIDSPLYNFSCVVDDFEMKVSHVIRGEDHISNTPKQILLQEALGFPSPKYGHLPLILGPDRSKLSKRHGTVSISEYREQGYLPEAIVNFMAFFGWNPDSEREIYTLNSLIKEFSLEKVQKGGAVFNIKRLDFLNGFYIRQKSIEKLTELCLSYLIETGLVEPTLESKERVPSLTGYFGKEIVQEYFLPETKEKVNFDYLQKVVSIYQERLKKLSEIGELTDFFFKDKLDYDKNLLRWRDASDKEISSSLDKLGDIFYKMEVSDFTKEGLSKVLIPAAENFAKEIGKGGDRGYLLWPLRVALSGKQASAGPFEIAEIMGKEKVLKRIKEARERLKS